MAHLKVSKVYRHDHKPVDDNDGYLYGIEYLDESDGEVQAEWYRTEKMRDQIFIEWEQQTQY